MLSNAHCLASDFALIKFTDVAHSAECLVKGDNDSDEPTVDLALLRIENQTGIPAPVKLVQLIERNL